VDPETPFPPPGTLESEGPPPPTQLGALPLARWATRLLRGTVEMRGNVHAAVDLPFGNDVLRLPAGPLSLQLGFVGGPEPWISRLVLTATGLEVPGGWRGDRLLVVGDAAAIDETTRARLGASLHIGTLARTLLDHVGDVSVQARAEPDGDLLLRLGGGVEAIVPSGVLLTASGATTGPASDLQLSEPLVVDFGGEGLRFSHEQFRWLARLAVVRLGSATLHPDGSVALEGAGSGTVDVAMRAPLQRASARLSDLVRKSPQFGRVRSFLKRGP
jgi:hypothetical protein